MKIIKRVGDFVIKETNEKERSYDWRGERIRSNMENFYIYHKDHSANQYVDEYISTADTLEEAIEKAECEIAKSEFDLSLVAEKLQQRVIGVDLTASAEEIHEAIIEAVSKDVEFILGKIPYDVYHKVNYLNNTHEIMVETDVEPYKDIDTMLFTTYDTTEITLKLKLIGTYISSELKRW